MVSNNATKHRARSDEDKIERLNAILDAARAEFAERGFDQVSMADIAARAGVAKGTLYLYCRAKEEVFLALLNDLMAGWFAALEEALATPHPRADLALFARFFARSAADRPDLVRLIALLHIVLERNVSDDILLPFRAGLRDALIRMSQALEGRFAMPAGVDPGWGARFLIQAYALTIGFANVASPAPAAAHILERDDMALLRVDFAAGLEAALVRLAAGYRSVADGEAPA